MKTTNPQTVLITGAGGFIGSHLVEKCLEQGYRVKAFVRYNSTNRWGWIETISDRQNISVVCGDIRDYDSVYRAIQGCDTVFHLAALIGIPYSYHSPLAYIRTNIEGTYNILQASKEQNVPNILIISTSEIYGSAKYVPIDESHPISGQSPYAASKIAAEQLALSYYRSFKLPVKVVRPFNTYGPRQSARAVIPTIISQLLKNPDLLRVGNLTPKRDFTYVGDTVNAFIEIANYETLFGETINIGMNHEISMLELVQMIASLLNVKTKIEMEQDRIRPEKSEVSRLCCDNSKLLKMTKWKPGKSLKEGLAETIQWFQANLHFYKSELYNV